MATLLKIGNTIINLDLMTAAFLDAEGVEVVSEYSTRTYSCVRLFFAAPSYREESRLVKSGGEFTSKEEWVTTSWRLEFRGEEAAELRQKLARLAS